MNLEITFQKKKLKEIRIKFHNTKEIDEYLKELEQKDSLQKQKNKSKSVIPRNYKSMKCFLKS